MAIAEAKKTQPVAPTPTPEVTAEKKAQASAQADGQAKRGRKSPPSDETPAQRFVRLANRRVPRAIKTIGYVTNLGKSKQYEFTQDQAKKIMQALLSAYNACFDAFAGKQSDEGWTL